MVPRAFVPLLQTTPKKAGLDDTLSGNRSHLLSPWAFQKLDSEQKKWQKREWNEIPFAFKNRIEKKWMKRNASAQVYFADSDAHSCVKFHQQ